MAIFELAPPDPPAQGFVPFSGAGALSVGKRFETRIGASMPTTIIVSSLEIALMRCRRQVARLDEELLLCLIDIMLLHVRRKAAYPKQIDDGRHSLLVGAELGPEAPPA